MGNRIGCYDVMVYFIMVRVMVYFIMVMVMVMVRDWVNKYYCVG